MPEKSVCKAGLQPGVTLFGSNAYCVKSVEYVVQIANDPYTSAALK